MESKQTVFEVSLSKSVLAERQENLVEGPFAEIHWAKLLSIAELNAKIVGRHFGLDLDVFDFRHGFRESGNLFSACVRVCLASSQTLPRDVVGQLLLSTACAITSEQSGQGGLFPFDTLPDALPSGPICEFLQKNGGKRIPDNMVITSQNEIIAQVGGSFASRPADKLNNSEGIRVSVIVDEICVSGRGAVCREMDGTKIRISFSEALLLPLASALALQCLVRIDYEESLDAKGLRFLNLRYLRKEDGSDFELLPLM
jgi:hypothetical protein